MTDFDRVWDNGWGKTLTYLAELTETLRRQAEKNTQNRRSGSSNDSDSMASE